MRFVGPHAVERLGQDAGGARLAGSTRAGEHVAVGDGAVPDGIGERACYVRLPAHLFEGLRAVRAVQRLDDIRLVCHLPAYLTSKAPAAYMLRATCAVSSPSL